MPVKQIKSRKLKSSTKSNTFKIRRNASTPIKKAAGKKIIVGAVLLFLTLAASILLLLIFQFNHPSPHQKQAAGTPHQEPPPVRLTIPAINVNAAIESLGINDKGEMAVPHNTIDVGWFNLGSHPGETGSAVIAGHLDGENGESGVFTNLNKLKKGDKLYVKNSRGVTMVFAVRESRTYDPGYADLVFSPSSNAHLNLITCDGIWDGAKKSFSKRLVVFADLIH